MTTRYWLRSFKGVYCASLETRRFHWSSGRPPGLLSTWVFSLRESQPEHPL